MTAPLPLLPPPEERRRLRDAMGITCAAAAAELEVSPRTLLRWEWGDAEPVPASRRRYGALLEQWRQAVDAR